MCDGSGPGWCVLGVDAGVTNGGLSICVEGCGVRKVRPNKSLQVTGSMATLRCTKKLLAQVGVKPAPVEEFGDDDWHANLVWVERKKHVLFCSDQTLFCCVTPPVHKSEIQSLNELFLSTLGWAMQRAGFTDQMVRRFLSKHESMMTTTTRNRSVLGSMNDYVYHLKHN